MFRRQVEPALDYVHLHVSMAYTSLNTCFVLKKILTRVCNSTIVSIGSAIQ